MPEDEFQSYEVLYKPVVLDEVTYPIPAIAMHRPACRHFLAGKLFELITHKFFIAWFKHFPGNTVHAGAFFGDMLPTLSQHCNGNVYSFEPVLENYVLAHHCVRVNQLENVFLFNAAVGAKLGSAYIRTRDADGQHLGGGSIIAKRSSLSDGQRCVTMTIDSLRLRDVTLIHLDVEGHEHSALVGASRTIARLRPALLLENPGEKLKQYLSSIDYVEALSIPSLKLHLPRERCELPDDVKFVHQKPAA